MTPPPSPQRDKDLTHLRHCLDLARQALDAGDEPFGSVLVNADGKEIATARNRVNEQNILAHPEIALVRWALDHLSADERRQTTMYTTGEHCPMCAAAHGWGRLGRIVYIHSGKQLGEWLSAIGAGPSPITFVPIQELVPNLPVTGPVPELLPEIKEMQLAYHVA